MGKGPSGQASCSRSLGLGIWNRQSGVTGAFQASPPGPDSSPCAGGRYIEVFREKAAPVARGALKSSSKPWQGRTLGEDEEEEDLADSGRLFVRNLPYTSTEEDLEKIFSKYGGRGSPGHGAESRQARLPGPGCPSALDLGLMTSPPVSVSSSMKWAGDPSAAVRICTCCA